MVASWWVRQVVPMASAARRVLRVRQLYDGTGRPPTTNMAVMLDGPLIAAVESCGPDWRAADGWEVTDYGERTLLPGLLDTHVHVTLGGGQTVRENIDRLLREDEDTLLLRGIANAQQALLSGVTTARDCGGRGLVTLRVRDAVAAGLALGPRLLVAGMPVTPTAGHLWWMGLQADTADEVRRTVRWLCEQGCDFIKVAATGGMMTDGSNPWAAQYSAAEMQVIVDEAHRLGRHVAAHVLSAPGLANVLEAGVDTVEHVWSSAGARRDYDPLLAERMARQGMFGSVTVSDALWRLLPELSTANLELMHERLAVHRLLREAGVPLVLHSDATGPPNHFGGMALGIQVLVRGLDYSVHEAIHACTGLAARAIGLGDQVGEVIPGKRADLVVVDGDPGVDLVSLGRVHQVWRDGEIVVDGGRLIDRG
jgi:imidazolonepropionase-like amidohydrolase